MVMTNGLLLKAIKAKIRDIDTPCLKDIREIRDIRDIHACQKGRGPLTFAKWAITSSDK